MPRHGTKSVVLKKRFRPHWNESVGTNGSGGCSVGYNGYSVNMLTNRVSHSSQMAKRKFLAKSKEQKYQSNIFFLLFSTNLIYAEFDSLRALKKEVAKDD